MHPLIRMLLVLCLAAVPIGAQAMSLDDLLFYGTESLSRGRFDQAGDAFAAALAKDPQNPYASGRLALAKLGAGRVAQARKLLEASLAARGDDLFALWTLGCLELLEGHPEAAGARFTAMGQVDPGNVRSLVGQGLAAVAAGRTRDGLVLLAKAQQADSGDALARLLSGLAFWMLDAPANARLELEATLELEPRNAAALDLLGLVYKRLGKTGLAKSAWEQALTVDASDARARFFLSRLSQDEALAASLSDRPEEAKRAYERALSIDPGNAAAAKALGVPIPMAAPQAAPTSPRGDAPGGKRARPREDPAKPAARQPAAAPAKPAPAPATPSAKATADALELPGNPTADTASPAESKPVKRRVTRAPATLPAREATSPEPAAPPASPGPAGAP
ncbi:tetratricopeptide repeat protein, partial [Solidesulfovibrio alcoholivorans]|uniref:tetratricopeptide repeat protein n=1 Tax=Solidesulfovibrio alcoholivorans TaxID=81406 RepID=UPI0004965F0C